MYEEEVVKLIKKGILIVGKDNRIFRRYIYQKNRFTKRRLKKIDKKLMEFKTPSGYKRIALKIEGFKNTTIAVHRILWCLRHGTIDENLTINHKDGNKTNNCIDNLELVTCKENIEHGIKTGLITINGEDNSNAKLTEAQVHKIRQLRKEGVLPTKIIQRLNLDVNRQNIYRICKRITWKHI